MNNYDNDSGDSEPKRLIYEMRRRVQAARNQYWDEGVEGTVSTQTHLDLAKAAIQYYDILYEFRSEAVLDEGDFPDISPVRKRIGHKVERRVQSTGLGRGETTKQVPAVTDVPVEHILDLTEQLDDLAKKLGFGAKAVNRRPIYHAGKLDPEDYDEPVKDTIPKPE